jgi:hypothetical protein
MKMETDHEKVHLQTGKEQDAQGFKVKQHDGKGFSLFALHGIMLMITATTKGLIRGSSNL